MENRGSDQNTQPVSAEGQEEKHKKITSKQAVALGGVILIVLMYLATLVIAIVDTSASMHWFAVSLFATVFIPFLIWIYAWLYKRITGKDD